jgi:predicted nucleic acid-binding protein
MDVCCLQRPLDDRSQLRINVEAEAVLTILRLVESGQIELVSSDVSQFEIGRIPNLERQARVAEIINLAGPVFPLTEEIEHHAESLVKAGVKPIDALHLAAALKSGADRFCTCDDRLLKIRDRLKLVGTIVSPLELVAEVTS